MIVKIQKPFMTNGSEPIAFIYDEFRAHETQVPLSTVDQLFFLNEYKIYHHAHMEGTILHIDERTQDQDW